MKKLIVLLGILFTYSSFAQGIKISGQVENAHEDRPIQNAVVSLFTPKDSLLYLFTRTDTSGKYILKDVKL